MSEEVLSFVSQHIGTTNLIMSEVGTACFIVSLFVWHVSDIHDYLMSEEVLSFVSQYIGTTDLIMTEVGMACFIVDLYDNL